jgi:DNA-binding transcriptional regulator YiaG
MDPQELRTIRYSLGLTQKQLGMALHVSHARISQWEHGVGTVGPLVERALLHLARQHGVYPPTSPTARDETPVPRLEPDLPLSTREAAALLGVTPYTLNEWARLGLIRCRQYTPRGRRYFSRGDVKEYIAVHTTSRGERPASLTLPAMLNQPTRPTRRTHRRKPPGANRPSALGAATWATPAKLRELEFLRQELERVRNCNRHDEDPDAS